MALRDGLFCSARSALLWRVGREYSTQPTHFIHHRAVVCSSSCLLRILELGTGTGLVGMLVSKLMTDGGGVHDVVDDDDEAGSSTTATTPVPTTSNSIMVLTDGDEEAMRLLQQNLADPYNKIDSGRVKATFLRWNEQLDEFDDWCRRSSVGGSSTTSTTADAAASTAKSHRSDDLDDDTATTADVEFDIILAGDVMYKQELPMLFFQTVQRYLNKKGGALWLCHVPRATVTHQVVIDAAAVAGFSMVPILTGASLVFEDHPGIAKQDDDWLDTEQRHTIQDCPREDLDRAVVYQITRAAE